MTTTAAPAIVGAPAHAATITALGHLDAAEKAITRALATEDDNRDLHLARAATKRALHSLVYVLPSTDGGA